MTEALLVSGEGRDSNPRRRETGVTTFKKKAAALVHSATSPLLRILYSPECLEVEFCEVPRTVGGGLSGATTPRCVGYALCHQREEGGRGSPSRRHLMPLLQSLQRVRKERGMSVKQLSAKSAISADSISEFEELRRMASVRTTRRLAEALGVDEQELR